MYRVDYSRSAAHELSRLARSAPPGDVRAIRAAIEGLAGDPRPTGARKLEALEDLYRLRVRDYRVIYALNDESQLVVVTRVARRSETTYRDL